MPLPNRNLPGMSNYNDRPADIPNESISKVSKPIKTGSSRDSIYLIVIITVLIIIGALYYFNLI